MSTKREILAWLSRDELLAAVGQFELTVADRPGEGSAGGGGGVF